MKSGRKFYVQCKLRAEHWLSYQTLKKLCDNHPAIVICLDIEEDIEQSDVLSPFVV